jgi:hypothetical protein
MGIFPGISVAASEVARAIFDESSITWEIAPAGEFYPA